MSCVFEKKKKRQYPNGLTRIIQQPESPIHFRLLPVQSQWFLLSVKSILKKKKKFSLNAKINLRQCFKTSIGFNAISFLIMLHLQNVACTNITRTDFQNSILQPNLMRFQRKLGKLVFDNRCFKWHKKETKLGKRLSVYRNLNFGA